MFFATCNAAIPKGSQTGDAYRKVELEQLKKVPKNTTMHLGRGVKTTTAGEIPEPHERLSTEGMTRVTSRGTSSRASRNKGTKED